MPPSPTIISNPLTVQDILNRLNPLLSNYTTGAVDNTSRIAAINSAVEYIKRYMTFPSDEKKQQFLYYEDSPFIQINGDFNEGLAVVYDDPDANHESKQWNYSPYIDILQKQGDKYPRTKWWSWTPINGFWQLIMYGKNRNHGTPIQTFDYLTGITGVNDAQSLAIDTNIYEEGNGSLSFSINPTLGNGLASIEFSGNWDFSKVLNNNGLFKLYVWLASTAISAVNIRLYTDSTDYYALTATTFDDASAFTTGLDVFKRVQLSFTGDTVVGSPNIKNITQIRIDLVEGAGFGGSTVTQFRIDNLYTIFPDLMDLIYLTSYKGTNKTGTPLQFFTDPTDVPSFGAFTPDILDIVAYRAAVILVPQIMSNDGFRSMYKTEVLEQLSLIGKSWPRKRTLNMGKMHLMRSQ